MWQFKLSSYVKTPHPTPPHPTPLPIIKLRYYFEIWVTFTVDCRHQHIQQGVSVASLNLDLTYQGHSRPIPTNTCIYMENPLQSFVLCQYFNVYPIYLNMRV